MDLEQALGQFDRVEANLARLEAVSSQMQALIPGGIVFSGSGPEELRYEQLQRSFSDLSGGLPPIDSVGFDAEPATLNEIAQGRLDAEEVGEPELFVRLQEAIDAPTRELVQRLSFSC